MRNYSSKQVFFIVMTIGIVMMLGLLLFDILNVSATQQVQTLSPKSDIIYTRITTSTDTNRQSREPSINSDGTKIAFRSNSDLLNEGLGGLYQVWLYDTTTMAYTRITTSTHPNTDSREPSINSDGTKVAFESNSDLLNEGLGIEYQVWLYDTTTMAYTRITTSTHPNTDSRKPSINSDGTKIAFYSNSDLLNEGVLFGEYEVWLYDTTTMTYTRITTSTDINRDSFMPSINSDGTKIAFSSESDLLNEGLDSQLQVWLYDTTTMAYTRITTSTHPNGESLFPSINSDGTKIAFYSNSDLLNEGLGIEYQVWLYDTTTMAYTRITTSTHPNRDSWKPSINSDGTKIAFYSDSDLLNEGLGDSEDQVWLYDTTTMTYARITTSTDINRDSRNPSINSDGTKIVFRSNSDLLNEGLDSQFQVWLSSPSYFLYLPIVYQTGFGEP